MHASKSSINRETPELVIQSIFKRYDQDQSGALDPKEFANALDDLGIIDEYEQAALFALADADNSKTIEYEEFLRLIKGHDFEVLLSNRDDYLFIIETYKTFQEYDIDGDGEVSWNEFYHYLSGHGYTHEYISQYWHYLDNDQTLTITFDEFWKGFKAQAEALKQQALHQDMTTQLLGASDKSVAIDEYSNYLSATPTSPNSMLKRKSSHRARLLGGAKHQRIKSLIGNNSYHSEDKNNIFRVMKRHLKKTKTKKRSGAMKLGRVVESDDEDEEFDTESLSESPSDDEDDSDGRHHLGLPLTSMHVRKSNSMDDLMVNVRDLTTSDEYRDSIDDDDMDSSELLGSTTSSYDSDSLDATESESMSVDMISDEEDDMLLAMTQDIMMLGRDLHAKSQDDAKEMEYQDEEEEDEEESGEVHRTAKVMDVEKRESVKDNSVNRRELKKNTDRDKEMKQEPKPTEKEDKSVVESVSIANATTDASDESIPIQQDVEMNTTDTREDKISTKSNEETKASESNETEPSTVHGTKDAMVETTTLEKKADNTKAVIKGMDTEIMNTDTTPKSPAKSKSKDSAPPSNIKTVTESTIQKDANGTSKGMKAKKKSIATVKDLKAEDDDIKESHIVIEPKTPDTPVKSVYIKKKKRKIPKQTQTKTKPKVEPPVTTKPEDKTRKKKEDITTSKIKTTQPKPPKPMDDKATKQIDTKPKAKTTQEKPMKVTKPSKPMEDKETKSKAFKDTKETKNGVKAEDDRKEDSNLKEAIDTKLTKPPIKSVYIKKKKRKSGIAGLKTPTAKVRPKTPTKAEDKSPKQTEKKIITKTEDKCAKKPAKQTETAKPKKKQKEEKDAAVKPKPEKKNIAKTQENTTKQTESKTPKHGPKFPSRSKLKLKRAASGDLEMLRRLPPKRRTSRHKRSHRSMKTGSRLKRKHKHKIEKINTDHVAKPRDKDFVFVSTPPPGAAVPPPTELKLTRSDSKEIKVSEAAAVVVAELGEASKDNTTDQKPSTKTESVGEKSKPKKKLSANKPRDKKRSGLLKPKKKVSNNKRSSTPNFIRHNKLKNNAPHSPKRTRFTKKKKRSKPRLKIITGDTLPSGAPTFRTAISNPDQKTNKLNLTPGAPSALMKKKSKHRMAYSSQTPDPDLDSLIDTVLSPTLAMKKKSKHKMAYSAQTPDPDLEAMIDIGLSPKQAKPRVKRKKKKKSSRRRKKSKVPKYKKRRGSLDLDTEAVAIHKSDKNVLKKRSKQRNKRKYKLHTNYRVRDKEQRRKDMERLKKEEEEASVMSRSQTERKPPPIAMKKKKKKKVRIAIPDSDKKAQKKRVTFTNTGNKVSQTLAKLRIKMTELHQTQNKPLKRQMMTPRDIRKQTKKSDYIQRKSVGHGFDLFKNYRMKPKEEKQKKERKQVQIQTQLREKKKKLLKPDKLDKRYKKKGERKKQGKHKKVEISSPFETKLTETMYDHRPSLRGKLKKKGKKKSQFEYIEYGGSMVYIEEENEKEFSDKKKKKKAKNADHKEKKSVSKPQKKKSVKQTPKKEHKKEAKKAKNDRRGMGNNDKKKKRKGHKRTSTKHGSWELEKRSRDLGHLDIAQKKNYRVRDKEQRRKEMKTDESQSQTEKNLPTKKTMTKRKKGSNANQSATEKKANKKGTKEKTPPLSKLKGTKRKLSHEDDCKTSGKHPSKLKLRRALSSDHKLMAKSLHDAAKNVTRKKMRRKPRRQPPLPSPKQSPRYARKKSPAQSPAQSPRYSRKKSPGQSPAQSPRYSRKKSPAQSPKQSPRYSRKKSPGQSPAQSPRYARKKSPAQSPKQSPRHARMKRPQSPAQSPKQSPRFARKRPQSPPNLSPHPSPPYGPKSGKNRKQRNKMKGNTLALDAEAHNHRSKSTMGLHGARKNNIKRGRSDVEVRSRSKKKSKANKQGRKESDDPPQRGNNGDYTIKVKVLLNQDIRRWRYHNQCNLAALKSFAAMSFDLIDTFRLQYEDDEGDVLTLHSENDLYDAFECAEEEDRKSLKIYVAPGRTAAISPRIRKAKTQRGGDEPLNIKSKSVKSHKKKSMDVQLNIPHKKGRKRERANSMEADKVTACATVNVKKEPQRRKGKKEKSNATNRKRSDSTNKQKEKDKTQHIKNGRKRNYKSPQMERSQTERKKEKNKKESGVDREDESSISKFAMNIKRRLSGKNTSSKSKNINGKTKKIVKR